MSELKLEPGWLTRDIARASHQADTWQAAKQAPRGEPHEQKKSEPVAPKGDQNSGEQSC
jgi:hypothetical protein